VANYIRTEKDGKHFAQPNGSVHHILGIAMLPVIVRLMTVLRFPRFARDLPATPLSPQLA
jgi:hypothetical protein